MKLWPWRGRRAAREQELNREIEWHLNEIREEREADGLSPRQAVHAARREFGNVGMVQEDARAAWGWTLLEQFAQDLRYALRTMGANRLFTALAVASLALGIGANAAIYSFMDALLLRSLPVADPTGLVVLNWHAKSPGKDFVMHEGHGSGWGDAQSGETSGMFPYPAFEIFHKNDAIFSSLFGYFFQSGLAKRLNLSVHGQADLASVHYVTGDYFRGLGVRPAVGRLLGPDDDRVGAPAVAVVSYALSERRFGGAAAAPGQPILVDNLPFTVAGVAPPGFFGVDPGSNPDVYLPMHGNPRLNASLYLKGNAYWVEVMGRLRPGVSREQAQAALAPQFRQWVASTATTAGERDNLPALMVTEGSGGLGGLRRSYEKPFLVLLALVALVLALACANVANLLMARAAARRREMALRLSVGASRFRVVRQLLTESVLLASLGGLLGTAFAIWGIRFLRMLLAGGRSNFTLHADLNWHVLAAAAALTLLTGLLFGLAPALQSTRVDIVTALKEARSGRTGRSTRWYGGPSGMLVVGQIAISLLMLVGAGMFVRTLSNLESVNLGFDRENLLLFQLDALKAGHKNPEMAAFYGDLRRRFSQISGVRQASLSDESMINAGWGEDISVAGKPHDPETRIMSIGPTFFATMRIPVLAGRDIEESDRAGTQAVAVINERFAKVNFGDRNPLGEHVLLGDREQGKYRDMEIVGMVGNTQYGGVKRKMPPVVYFPYDQGYPEPEEMVFELRTAGNPLAFADAVRAITRQADSRLAVADMQTQAAEIDGTISQENTLAGLCSVFAALALVIASVGLYGTVAYNVARRTSEIGIRAALGARRGRLVWLVLREVLALAGIGIAISVPAALTASKLIESFLFGMKRNDPWVLVIATGTLLAAALVAAYLPARKASLIDPMVALRNE
jgi:macrolide transport system ATP-binding/permease protein